MEKAKASIDIEAERLLFNDNWQQHLSYFCATCGREQKIHLAAPGQRETADVVLEGFMARIRCPECKTVASVRVTTYGEIGR